MSKELDQMMPGEIVAALDKYIIGQDEAKKMIAIAIRNRTRRKKLDEHMKEEVTPKNILMIGPTGVGKTEIARRIAKLANAPFVKVEATKYTEVGYVGRDVESMIKDLMASAVNMVSDEMAKLKEEDVKFIRLQFTRTRAAIRVRWNLQMPPRVSSSGIFCTRVSLMTSLWKSQALRHPAWKSG